MGCVVLLHRPQRAVVGLYDASGHVLDACGFTFEGRLRSFLTVGDGRADALVYSRLRSDS